MSQNKFGWHDLETESTFLKLVLVLSLGRSTLELGCERLPTVPDEGCHDGPQENQGHHKNQLMAALAGMSYVDQYVEHHNCCGQKRDSNELPEIRKVM